MLFAALDFAALRGDTRGQKRRPARNLSGSPTWKP
jgi:hypothetical protein